MNLCDSGQPIPILSDRLAIKRRLRTMPPTINDAVPIGAVQNHLVSIEFPVESSPDLSFSVALKAKNRKILLKGVAWIIIDMMDLDCFSRYAANTAGAIRKEQNASRHFLGNLYSLILGHGLESPILQPTRVWATIQWPRSRFAKGKALTFPQIFTILSNRAPPANPFPPPT